MKIYIDSSWLLRVLLQQSRVNALPQKAEVYSSVLLTIECRRTFFRQFQRKLITDEKLDELNRQLNQYLEFVQLIDFDKHIVRRAAEPFLMPLGTLDALHLATALALSHSEENPIHFATFDSELALAASAHGFSMIRE